LELKISALRVNMSVNIKEANLEAITHSIAFMEKDENCDKELLKKLKEERDKLLKELNVSI
jgi:ribosomal 50S subunit-associated protein YjgA (DUF615 family)